MKNKPVVFGIYDQFYKGSNKISVASYFDEYKKVIEDSPFYKHFEMNEKSYLTQLVGEEIDEEKFDMLSEYCSIDNLTVDGELQTNVTKNTHEYLRDPYDMSVLNGVALQTVKDTKRRNELKHYQFVCKYRSEKQIAYEPVPMVNAADMVTPEKDMLVFVRIYNPFTSRQKQSTGVFGKLSVDCVVGVLGSQTLAQLRDIIFCHSDNIVSREMSQNPVRDEVPNAKDIYKAGFFFIENTFYNDFRDPDNKDISKVIRDWAETRRFGTLESAKMEETRIDSLCLKFGFPWVYQHQGDCEHLIAFSDARLINPTDELNPDCYPRVFRIKPRPHRYCMTCGLYSVTWVTTNNNRLPHNPCLFCDSCFKSYNYIDGKKIGSFRAYPYPYDSNLLQLSTIEDIRMNPSTSKLNTFSKSSLLNRKIVKDEKSDTTES